MLKPHPSVVVFGDRPFRRYLRLEEVTGGALIPEDCCPYTDTHCEKKEMTGEGMQIAFGKLWLERKGENEKNHSRPQQNPGELFKMGKPLCWKGVGIKDSTIWCQE